MKRPTLAVTLREAGHVVRACGYCGRVFAADLSHDGKPHAPQRLYCSTDCRDIARGRRRAPKRQADRVHRRRYAGLIHMHALEAAGQTAIGGPLPPIPAMTGANR